MIVTFEDIQKANESIVPILLKHKDKETGKIKENNYSAVNQRIKAFRMVYPTGAILTDMISNQNGVCIFTATCGYYTEEGKLIVLGSGTAEEKADSSFINKTSYIENCETSAVGRALGMCGFGVDTTIASLEEMVNALQNQVEPEAKATPQQIEVLKKSYVGANLTKLLATNSISKIEDLSKAKATELIDKLKKKKGDK